MLFYEKIQFVYNICLKCRTWLLDLTKKQLL